MSYRVYQGTRLYARDFLFGLRSSCRALLNKQGRFVLCNSFPKSGTHLLSQILMAPGELTYWYDIVSVQSLSGFMNTKQHIKWKVGSAPQNSLVRSHLMYDNEVLDVLAQHNVKRFFIYRDLRDVALSHAKWVMKEKRIFLHDIYKKHLANDHERLMASIRGIPLGNPFGSNISLPNIGEDFKRWQGWLGDQQTLCVKFEELVGSRGGGGDELRWETIRKILTHLEVDLSDNEMHEKFSFEALNPEQSQTFRKGKINGWKTAFTEEHKNEFKKVAGDLLISLGYENDQKW